MIIISIVIAIIISIIASSNAEGEGTSDLYSCRSLQRAFEGEGQGNNVL